MTISIGYSLGREVMTDFSSHKLPVVLAIWFDPRTKDEELNHSPNVADGTSTSSETLAGRVVAPWFWDTDHTRSATGLVGADEVLCSS